ncbi:NAD+ synthase [Pseudoduganella ginsengisoli]|uniref:Glutamine-dependent NAD(+) synthetase n=1 Tax=Pseudoduganella ginsengisoli TaxID=1462440 RepID=A0A6L6Q8P7_9BURK|nr:NAD+ synthase [Pseudoduganella ginsengisoli]MTW05611.1 NAD+ synthase [Pseudoduganella ginsengisoli]
MLRIAIAQTNPTIGDFKANTSAILAAMQQAANAHADLVVFPELAVCGYYPGDLLEDERFLSAMERSVARIVQQSEHWPHLTVILGTARPNRGPGKPLHNALLIIRHGAVIAEYYKQLLPTYGIFDEYRHFEPGPERACVLAVKGHRIGFLVCEDGWNDAGRDYAVNPFEALRKQKPELVISINASPSNLGKAAQRHALFGDAARNNGFAILFVNQVGGQDQLVFDGASFGVTPQQGVTFTCRQFEEELRMVAFDGGAFSTGTRMPAAAQPVDGTATAIPSGREAAPAAFYHRQILLGLRDYARRCGFTKAVIGSSGGIDSAITIALAAEALGADNVTAITMPSEWSSTGSVSDSQALCAALGVRLHTHPIAALVQQYAAGYRQAFGQPLHGLPLENLQARIRGTVLMEYSNAHGALLLTTGNKSEISVGYCTLYGDTNGGLGLIGDLYKTEVYALAQHINAVAGREIIPAAVLSKPPSAELAPGQRDTDSLPPYDVLDEILKWHIEGPRLAADEWDKARAFVEQLRQTDDGRALVGRILSLVARNEYKRRQAPPIIRVRARAFGSGRQLPIAAKFSGGNE